MSSSSTLTVASPLLPLLLFFFVLCSPVSALFGDQCVGGLIYDVPSLTSETPYVPSGTLLQEHKFGVLGEFVQLFVPPAIPYTIDKICFWIRVEGDTYSNVYLRLSLYNANDPSTNAQVSPQLTPDQTVQFPVVFNVNEGGWHSFNVSFVARSPRVFIGLSVASAKIAIWPGFSAIGARIPSYRRSTATAAFSAIDGNSNDKTSYAIRVAGAPVSVSGVPAGWKCSAAAYGKDGKCDCGCGLWDPDCASSPISANCSTGSVCSTVGTCVQPGWTNCPLTSYGTGDGCQCGCGGTMIDPDCLNGYDLKPTNCAGMTAPVCSDSLVCKETWFCNASLHNDGKVCNCGCGKIDPDCLLIPALPNDCAAGLMCWNATCKVPIGWTCRPSLYGAKDACDCACGAYDPDCDLFTVTPNNCPSSAGALGVRSCNYNSVCIFPGCGNNYTEKASEDCDGGYMCTSKCFCEKGYKGSSPRRLGCIPDCGDGIAVKEEQCDGGHYCSSTCTCLTGSVAYNPPRSYCKLCGNGVVDADLGEQCDGGYGCSSTCTCLDNYKPMEPLASHCQYAFPEPLSKGAFAGIIAGGSVAVTIVAGAAAISLYFLTRKRRVTVTLNDVSSPSGTGTGGSNDIQFLAIDEGETHKQPTTGSANLASPGGNCLPPPGSATPASGSSDPNKQPTDTVLNSSIPVQMGGASPQYYISSVEQLASIPDRKTSLPPRSAGFDSSANSTGEDDD